MRITYGLLVLTAAVACSPGNSTGSSSSSSMSTTSGGGTGTGSPSSTGNITTGTSASASTSTGTSSSSGAATSAGASGAGTTSGGWNGDAGPCSSETAFPTEFQPCDGSGVECQCGQTCVNDPSFYGLIVKSGSRGVCELPCSTNLDCDNAGSLCISFPDAGGRCTANICNAGIGQPCWANNGTRDGGPGTCVIQTGQDVSICMPNGVATESCDQGQYGLTNDDPQAGVELLQLYPQPAAEASLFCGAGMACLGNDFRTSQVVDKCLKLCSTSASDCDAGEVCLTEDSSDHSWGYCRPCPPVDLPPLSTCYLPSDCCLPSNCYLSRCCIGTSSFDGEVCHGDSDCCGHCDAGICGP